MTEAIYDFNREVSTNRLVVELHSLPPIERVTERWERITKATESVRRGCFVCGEYVDDGGISVLIGGASRPHHEKCWEKSKANVRKAVSR